MKKLDFRLNSFINYNGKKYRKTFKTADEARAWYLMKREEFVQLAEQELVYREIWWQKLKLVHVELLHARQNFFGRTVANVHRCQNPAGR